MMQTVLHLKHKNQLLLPPAFAEEDVRSSDTLVEHFLIAYTQPGDVVFDPFAGFGTTLWMAEKLGRQGYGLEYLPERAGYIGSLLEHPERVLNASALDLHEITLPPVDFSFTSPPYMSKNNHAEYPFAAYTVTGEGYTEYLRDIASIYRQLKDKLRPGARAVVEVSNIINAGEMTPLAWDVARCIGEVLHLEKEIIAVWEGEDSPQGNYGFGYDHCYCLVFINQ